MSLFRCADVVGEENVEMVLKNKREIVAPFSSPSFERILGPKSLFFQSGERHKKMRKALEKTFTNTVRAVAVKTSQSHKCCFVYDHLSSGVKRQKKKQNVSVKNRTSDILRKTDSQLGAMTNGGEAVYRRPIASGSENDLRFALPCRSPFEFCKHSLSRARRRYR